MSERFCYSTDGELFIGEFSTVAEAVEECAACDYIDASAFILGRLTGPPEWNICAETIQEWASESIYNELGCSAEGEYPDKAIIKKHVEAMLKELPPPTVEKVAVANDDEQEDFRLEIAKRQAPNK